MIDVPNLLSSISVPCCWGTPTRASFEPSEDPRVQFSEVMVIFCVTSLSVAGAAAERLRTDALLLVEDDLNNFGVGIWLGGKRKGWAIGP